MMVYVTMPFPKRWHVGTTKQPWMHRNPGLVLQLEDGPAHWVVSSSFFFFFILREALTNLLNFPG